MYSELREENTLNDDWHFIIWNNRHIRIDKKPFFTTNITTLVSGLGDLHFDLNNTESYEQIAQNIKKVNFLEWTGISEGFNTSQLKSS